VVEEADQPIREGVVAPHLADAELARRLATGAGALLAAVRAVNSAASAAELRSVGDRAAQNYLATELAAARPDDPVLSEEAADDRRRLTADRVWIVDPLDGTREFAEGRDDWAVHVALWADGDLVAGAVALPGLGQTLATDAPQPPPAPDGGRLRIAVSRTRAPDLARAAAAALDAELVPLGSAGYKTAAVILGEVDAYVHAGGQYEWDSAAPVVVARAAGLHASRLDGAPLEYNRPDPYLPDLLVCRPELATPLLSVCAPAAR
jgi:3'(2'), 5'-bisphosphate nucleotidase